MLTKPIPAWILGGGAFLAACAGCINAVGFLSMQHQAITHLTGTVSLLGVNLALGEWSQVIHTGEVFLAFFAGCVISGLIIRQRALQIGAPYGIALLLESCLLVTAAWLFTRGNASGCHIAALACGLQNAMASTYSGAVIRTTHVTGMITDLGISVGQLIRRESFDRRRTGLYSVLLVGFFGGGVGGAAGFLVAGYRVLYFPAAFTAAAGIAYFIVTHSARSDVRVATARD